MWSIFDDLYIKNEIDNLKPKVRSNKFGTNELPKFVFVCGQQVVNDDGSKKADKDLKENKRYYLMKELEKHKNKINGKDYNNIVCIISEDLYRIKSNIDLLTFEYLLAELSDEIIILVESDGTKCELGAFTQDEKTINKLFIVNDDQYAGKKSFINDGPIEKIKKQGDGKVIYVPYEFNEFKGCFEIKHHLEQIYKCDVNISPNKNEKKINIKGLIYELLNIIEIFQPLSKDELFYLYKDIKGFNKFEIENQTKIKIVFYDDVISLLKKLSLINVSNVSDDEFMSISKGITCYNALFKIDKLSLSSIRSKILCRMYKGDSNRFKVMYDEFDKANE